MTGTIGFVISICGLIIALVSLQLQINRLRSHLFELQDTMIETGRHQLKFNEEITKVLKTLSVNTMTGGEK